MSLSELYNSGEISFEEYTKRLAEEFNATIKVADKWLNERGIKCTRSYEEVIQNTLPGLL